MEDVDQVAGAVEGLGGLSSEGVGNAQVFFGAGDDLFRLGVGIGLVYDVRCGDRLVGIGLGDLFGRCSFFGRGVGELGQPGRVLGLVVYGGPDHAALYGEAHGAEKIQEASGLRPVLKGCGGGSEASYGKAVGADRSRKGGRPAWQSREYLLQICRVGPAAQHGQQFSRDGFFIGDAERFSAFVSSDDVDKSFLQELLAEKIGAVVREGEGGAAQDHEPYEQYC